MPPPINRISGARARGETMPPVSARAEAVAEALAEALAVTVAEVAELALAVELGEELDAEVDVGLALVEELWLADVLIALLVPAGRPESSHACKSSSASRLFGSLGSASRAACAAA
jgi:hypothetical protein